MHTFAELGNVSRHLVCLTRELATNLYEKWGACYPLVVLRWESLFSCWNSLQLGLYQSPVNVWNLKFCLPYLHLLEGSMSCGFKTSSVKSIYLNSPCFIWPCFIMENRALEGVVCCSYLPDFFILFFFSPSREQILSALAQDVSQLKQNETGQTNACFIAPNWRGDCMQSFMNLQLVFDWSYWKVSQEEQETFQ